MHRFSLAGAVVLFLAIAGIWTPADAQLRAASAQLAQITGPVQILPRGQVQWVPAAVGARLVEGDQIRAGSGGSAELTMPDSSTILVSENTRFAVTRMNYDPQSRDREMSFHLVAGKVRAQVARVATQLVRTRQANFAISTPAGVAAVRGTIIVQIYNPATGQSATFVLPSPGQDPATASALYVDRTTGQSTVIPANTFITQMGSGPPSSPTPISNLSPGAQQQLKNAVNAATANSDALTASTVVIVDATQVELLIQSAGVAAAGAVVTVETIPTSSPLPTTSYSRDTALTQQCASPPCP